jgi:hypothetical protein
MISKDHESGGVIPPSGGIKGGERLRLKEFPLILPPLGGRQTQKLESRVIDCPPYSSRDSDVMGEN